MLSPSMMTKSKENVSCSFNISSATSNCLFSPVPVSPMTPNRTDFGFSGSFSSSAEANGTVNKSSRNARRFIASCNHIYDEIDDQVRFDIAQNQIVPHHPVLEFGRQLR